MNRYWPLLKHYGWVVVACTLVALVVSVLIARATPPSYVASSTLLVVARAPGTSITQASASDPLGSVDEANTYAAEIPSRAVMSFVAKQYPQLAKQGISVDDLMADVTATPATSAATITLTATGRHPRDAMAMATDVANGFALYVQQQTQAQLDTMRTALQTELATYQKQKAALQQQLLQLANSSTNTASTVVTSTGTFTTSTSSSDPRFAVYSSDLDVLTQTISALQQQLSQLPATLTGDTSVIQQPTSNDVATSKKTLLIAAATVGIGLVVGLLAMLALIYLDTRLRTTEQVNETLGLAYLGSVATDEELNQSPSRLRGEAVRDVSSVFVGMHLTNVLPARSKAGEGKVLLVTSAQRAEGKTTLAAALAATMARSGAAVVLVDGNLRQPATHLALCMTPIGIGLSGLLQSEGALDDALQSTNVPGLWLLPVGAVTDYSTLLLERHLPEVLAQLRRSAEVIIIDGPTLLSDADAMVLANLVDGVALVADVRHTRMSKLAHARDLLTSLAHAPIGVVMNRLPARRGSRFFASTRPVTPEVESTQPAIAAPLSK